MERFDFNNSTVISEKQNFSSIWVWLLILTMTTCAIYATISQIILNIPFGDHPAPDFVLLLATLTLMAILFLLKVMCLKVDINEDEINIKFYPLGKEKIIRKEIKDVEIITYSPLKNYGGWGIRYGLKGKAYIIGGNIGLNVTLKNGKNILIGIRKIELYKNLTFGNNEDKN